jgi:hypothetical protein
MFETMYEAEGVGLAAPQVGVSKRIIVVDCGKREAEEERPLKAKEPYAIVNPVITAKDGKLVWEEGCLSVPGYTDEVERAATVRVEGLDKHGAPIAIEAEGLLGGVPPARDRPPRGGLVRGPPLPPEVLHGEEEAQEARPGRGRDGVKQTLRTAASASPTSAPRTSRRPCWPPSWDAGQDDVVLVVSQPDRPKGRGKKLEPTPVKPWPRPGGSPSPSPPS